MESEITFFSYSRVDSEFVLNLAKDLRNAGAKLWLDQLDIDAGTHWDSAIETALNVASHVIVVLSPSAVNSHNVMDEVSFALENGKTVIPVKLSDCKIPFRLGRLHYIDFTGGYDKGLNKLLEVLLNKEPLNEDLQTGTGKRKPPARIKKKKYILITAISVLAIIVILGLQQIIGTGNDAPNPIPIVTIDTTVTLTDTIQTDPAFVPHKDQVFDTNNWYRLTTQWQKEIKSMEAKDNYTVELDSSSNALNQAWKIIKMQNGYFRLFNRQNGNGMCVDLEEGTDHFTTRLAIQTNSEGQLWKIKKAFGGYYRLTSLKTGDTLALNVINDGNNNTLELNALKDTVLNDVKTKVLYGGQLWAIKQF